MRSNSKTTVFSFGRGHWTTEGLTIGAKSIGSVQASLDEVFAFGFLDKGLEFGSCKGVDQAGFGDNQQKDLCAGKNRQLVGLDVSLNNLRKVQLTFFMIPALRFEKVICLLDLSAMYSILILRRPGSPSLST